MQCLIISYRKPNSKRWHRAEFTTTNPNSRGETRTGCPLGKQDYSTERCQWYLIHKLRQNPHKLSPLVTIQLTITDEDCAVPSTNKDKVTADTYVSSPFKRALFWPNDSQPLKKKRTRENTACCNIFADARNFDIISKKMQEEVEKERKQLEKEGKKM